MRMRTLAVAAVMSLTGLTAFAQDVKVDFDRSADVARYKTFAVQLGTTWNNQLSEKRVTEEMLRQVKFDVRKLEAAYKGK